MKKGLYMHRDNVYYGRYDEKQVSGSVLVSAWVKPEQIHTDYPIKEGDHAVMFNDNHRLLEPELVDLQTMPNEIIHNPESRRKSRFQKY